ncbi:MAG TPA: hypothetical protein VH397_16485 [Xanthobacteraceae bacterium]|jgi:hypothetical protein
MRARNRIVDERRRPAESEAMAKRGVLARGGRRAAILAHGSRALKNPTAV